MPPVVRSKTWSFPEWLGHLAHPEPDADEDATAPPDPSGDVEDFVEITTHDVASATAGLTVSIREINAILREALTPASN